MNGIPGNSNARFLEIGLNSWFFQPRFVSWSYHRHVDTIFWAFFKNRTHLRDWGYAKVWHKPIWFAAVLRTISVKGGRISWFFLPRFVSWSYHRYVDTIFWAFLKIRSHLGDWTCAKVWHENDRFGLSNQPSCVRKLVHIYDCAPAYS